MGRGLPPQALSHCAGRQARVHTCCTCRGDPDQGAASQTIWHQHEASNKLSECELTAWGLVEEIAGRCTEMRCSAVLHTGAHLRF